MLGDSYRGLQDAHALGVIKKIPMFPAVDLAVGGVDEMQSIPLILYTYQGSRSSIPMISAKMVDQIQNKGMKGSENGTISLSDPDTATDDYAAAIAATEFIPEGGY